MNDKFLLPEKFRDGHLEKLLGGGGGGVGNFRVAGIFFRY